MARAITTEEDQPTTFVELFFDLVFVFAVTQVVAVVHHDLSWGYVARGAIVFWLVWWAWTQFTWALNSADTTHPGVEGVMLLATAVVFAMAVAIPTSFSSSGIWFASSYIAVRVIGLALYARVAWEHVAKLTIFVVWMDQIAQVRAAREAFYVEQGVQAPASTAVGVAGLAIEGALIEIEAYAVLE